MAVNPSLDHNQKTKVNTLATKVLSQFIENIPQFVWWKDTNSVFLGCNGNVARYVGLNHPEDIVGLTDYDIYEHKKDADFVRKIDQEIIESGDSQLNFEECLTMPGIGKRWLSTSKIPLYDEQKNIIGTVGWFNDITDIKEMQIQLNEKNKILFEHSLALKKALRDLEIVNIDLERFTYAASHDIKGPLTNIKAFTELLLDSETNQLDTEYLSYIKHIQTSANQMSNLVTDILDFAQTGSKNLVAEYVDIQEIVKEKIEAIKNPEKQDIDFQIHLPSKKVKVYPQLIGLIFYNLMHNGVKFNDSDKPKIICDYSENEHFWQFSVKDNGIGIDPQYASDIFKPFQRFSNIQREGTGLGLSICKRAVSLHNGEIWLENNTDGNTMFIFTISKQL